MEGRARAWFLGAWVCLALLVAILGWVAPHGVVVCRATLVAVPEPAGWRDWPLADPKAAWGGACPGDGVAREGWYGDGPGPPERWIRHDTSSGVFVVGGAPRAEEAPRERFVSAFRREPGGGVAFTSAEAAVCCLTLGLALAVILVGLAAARRRLRAAGALAASSRDAHLALSAGPASYRSAPAPRAREALEGAYDARSAEGARLAIGALRTSLLAVLGLFAVFLVCAGSFVLREWVRLMF